jgi:hypothetical protein
MDWPEWWTWELEFTPHLEERMEDRDFNEVDLREMLQRGSAYRADAVEGRWVVETRHRGTKLGSDPRAGHRRTHFGRRDRLFAWELK